MESTIREEKPKKTSHPDRVFEVSLSNEQYHVIRTILPLGYSLKERKKKKRLSFSIANPVKKVHFEKTIHPSEKRENLLVKKVPPRYPPPFDSEAKIESILKNFKYSQEWQLLSYKKILLLKKHPSANPFLFPVDYMALNLPDYPLVIKNPMDLSTIERRIKNFFYKSQEDFEKDVDLIWSNSMTYNLKGTKIYEMTLEMKIYSEKLRDEGKKRKEGTESKIDKMIKKLENIANQQNEEEYDEEIYKNKKDFNEERVREYFRSKMFEKELQEIPNSLIYPIYIILDKWKINLENEKLNVNIDDPELVGFLREIHYYMRKNKKTAEQRLAHHLEKENYKINETSSCSSFITDSDISESD